MIARLALCFSLALLLALPRPAAAADQEIVLEPGFNFVSLTVAPTPPLRSDTLLTDHPSIASVFKFDPAAQAFVYQLRIPGGTLFGSPFEIPPDQGVVVRCEGASTFAFPVSGTPREADPLANLLAGFNFVGLQSRAGSMARALLQSRPDIASVFRWNRALASFGFVLRLPGDQYFGDDFAFEAGKAYFVRGTGEAPPPSVAVVLRVLGPATATAGVPVTVTIRALDAGGHAATGYSGDRSIAFTGPAASPAGVPPTVASASGAAVPFGNPVPLAFTGGVASAAVTFVGAGPCSLDADDGTLSSAADPAHDLDLVVEAGPVAAYRVQVPAALPLRGPFAMTVAPLDAFGNPALGAAAVTLAASVSGTLAVTGCDCSAGPATIAAQTFDQPGPVVFTASAAGASGQSEPATVAAAPANLLTLPATGSRRNDARVDYTLGAASASATLTWTRSGGADDPASPHVAALAGEELAAGRHPLVALANAPALVDGAVYTLRLDSVASAGGAAALPVTVTGVTYDAAGPVVVAVGTAAADGTFLAGATIDLTLAFSEPVRVDTTGGTPALALDSGGAAHLLSGSGTATLTFRYIVSSGEESADLAPASAAALSPDGGAIGDEAGNPASLALPDPALFRAAHALRVDAVPPAFSMRYFSDEGLTAPLAGNPRLSPGTYWIAFTASEPLAAAPTVSIQAEGGSNDIVGSSTTPVTGNIHKFRRTIVADDAAVGVTLELVAVSGADLAGNAATDVAPADAASRAAYTDTTPPTVAMEYFRDPALSDAFPEPLPFLKEGTYYLRLTASEPLAAAPLVSFDAEGANNDSEKVASTHVSGNSVYLVTRTIVADPAAVGHVQEALTVELRDAAGNLATAVPTDAVMNAAFTDTTPPFIYEMRYYADPDCRFPLSNGWSRPRLKAGVYYIKFSSYDPLSSLDLDITGTEGGVNDVTDGTFVQLISAPSDTGFHYLYTRTIVSSANAVGATPENLDLDLVDPAGNVAKDSDPGGEEVMSAFLDTVAPTFTIQYYSDEGCTNPLGANPKVGPGTYHLAITSSEPLAAAPVFTIAAQGEANDVEAGATVADSGNVYRATRTILADAASDGTVPETFAITGADEAGNPAAGVAPTNAATAALRIDPGTP